MLARGRAKGASIEKVTSWVLATLLALLLAFFCVGSQARSTVLYAFGNAMNFLFGSSAVLDALAEQEAQAVIASDANASAAQSGSSTTSASSKAATNAASSSGSSASKAANDAVLAGATEASSTGSVAISTSKKYKVTYEWEGLSNTSGLSNEIGIPVALDLPTQKKVREGEEITINPLYEKGTTVYEVSKEGVITGWYTFSGWMYEGEVVSGTMTMPAEEVTFTGTWEHKEKDDNPLPSEGTHEITYTWTNGPSTSVLYTASGTAKNVLLPSGELCEQGVPYTVNTTYYPGYTLYEHDTNGYVCASYTFSGWKIDGTAVEGVQYMESSDVTISGTWTRVAIEAPHVIRYEWTDAPDTSLELYDEEENVVPIALPEGNVLYEDSLFTLDTTYTPGMKLYRYSADGYALITYTFSGWTVEGTQAPAQITVGSSDITICGTWTASMITYDITYSWAWKDKDGNNVDAPDEDQVFYDEDGNVIDYEVKVPGTLAKAPGAIVDVDTQFTDETVLYVHDEAGKVIGRYEFSGWDYQGELYVEDYDVEIKGEWTYYEQEE